MKLLTPCTISQKENCDLCWIKTNKRKATEGQLFKTLYGDRFDFFLD